MIFVGTGGQGVLTVARLLSDAYMKLGYEVVSGQLHGMAQRGGSVQSSICVNAGACPVIAEGESNCLVGFEPIETARARSFLNSKSLVIMNTAKVNPFVLAQRHVQGSPESGRYPSVEGMMESLEEITPRVYALDGSKLAEENGTLKNLNMVMLGTLLGSSDFVKEMDQLWGVMSEAIPSRIRESSMRAFLLGVSSIQRLEKEKYL